METRGDNQKNRSLLSTLYKDNTPVLLKINGNGPVLGKIGFGISIYGKPFFRPLNSSTSIESTKNINKGFHFVPNEQPLVLDQGYPIHLSRMNIHELSQKQTEFKARITYYDPTAIRVDATFKSSFK